jgi:hypothetical protein
MLPKKFRFALGEGPIGRSLGQFYPTVVLTLKANELGSLGPAVLLKPVRVGEPRRIVVGMPTDVLQKAFFRVHQRLLTKSTTVAE